MLILSLAYAATVVVLGLFILAQKKEIEAFEATFDAYVIDVQRRISHRIRVAVTLALQGFRPVKGGNSNQRRLARRAFARAQKLGNA